MKIQSIAQIGDRTVVVGEDGKPYEAIYSKLGYIHIDREIEVRDET